MDALLALGELATSLIHNPRAELFIVFGCIAAFPLLVLLMLMAHDCLQMSRRKAA